MNEFLNLLEDGIPLDFKLAESFRKTLESLLAMNVLVVRKNRYFLQKKFCIGRVELTRRGSAFLLCASKGKSRSWFVEKQALKDAQRGDIVLAQALKKRKNLPTMAKVLQVLEEKEQTILCYLEKYQSGCMAISIPNEIPYKISASQKSLKTLPANTILQINPKNGEILEILGALNDPKIDEILTLKLHNAKETFTLAAELEAESFKEVRLRNFKERMDYTHLPFCAIDPIGAKDHDDAVYFDTKNSTLYVAVADVSYYVRENSALDREAYQRCFSIYFPHKAIPMLPRALSENLCSLKENHLRLAMVWKIRLHRRTKAVLESVLSEAVIKVRQKLTYEEVDMFLENRKSQNLKRDVRGMLWDLNLLAQQLRKKRLQGGFDFLNTESVMELDYNLELKNLKIESQSLSHQLVEECMLLANQQSAQLQTQKVTQGDERLKLGIYRVHRSPREESIQELFMEFRLLGLWDSHKIPKDFHRAILKVQKKAKDLKIEREVDNFIIKSMQQATYASHNIGHFGLGFKEYSHFTSPIRRYSDLILHRILKAKIQLQQNSLEFLPRVCAMISQKEREVAKIEMEFKDRKFARFLHKKIGQSYIGRIVNENSMFITLMAEPLQGARVICLKGSGVKHQKVRVEIVDVNLATAKIYGRIVEIFNEGFGIQNEKITQYFSTKMHQKAQRKMNQIRENSKRIAREVAKSKKWIPKHKRRKKGV